MDRRRKSAAQLGGGRSYAGEKRAAAVPDAFEISEEKQLVANNLSTDSSPVLVIDEVPFGQAGAVVEKVVRVELPVAEKFERAAVPFVGAPLARVGDHAAAGAAVLRVIEVGADALRRRCSGSSDV